MNGKWPKEKRIIMSSEKIVTLNGKRKQEREFRPASHKREEKRGG
jgi:hypothetical protein